MKLFLFLSEGLSDIISKKPGFVDSTTDIPIFVIDEKYAAGLNYSTEQLVRILKGFKNNCRFIFMLCKQLLILISRHCLRIQLFLIKEHVYAFLALSFASHFLSIQRARLLCHFLIYYTAEYSIQANVKLRLGILKNK